MHMNKLFQINQTKFKSDKNWAGGSISCELRTECPNLGHKLIKISKIHDVVLCTGTSSFKHTKENGNRIRIEGGE